MTTIEVLAPLRIETRFRPPDPEDPASQWVLQLRVFPDEFSIAHPQLPPTPDELALVAALQAGDLTADDAFASLADAVGAPRATWLLRGPGPAAHQHGPEDWPSASAPLGLPPELEVWIVPAGAPRYLAETLHLDRQKIGEDLEPGALATVADTGVLPKTWWLSFERACAVDLGCEIPLGTSLPDIEALVVVGIGDTAPDNLLTTHAASGRLAVLAPGTPTNTVEGEPTTDLGTDRELWHRLVTADPLGQPSTVAVWHALTGTDPTVPLSGADDRDPLEPGWALVDALWPALWARSFRDVLGVGAIEPDIHAWARKRLKVEGPFPAIRVGAVPYGLLPATVLDEWIPDPADGLAAIDARLAEFARRWRDLADAAAAAEPPTVLGADTASMLQRYGDHAPSRYWRIRPVQATGVASVTATAFGYQQPAVIPWHLGMTAALGSTDDEPIAPFWFPFDLPDDLAGQDNPELLRRIIDPLEDATDHDGVIFPDGPYGLFGHLLREAAVAARLVVGQAYRTLYSTSGPLDPNAPLPVWTPPSDPDLDNLLNHGSNHHVLALRQFDPTDPRHDAAVTVAERFIEWQRAAVDFVENHWANDPGRSLQALLAALDTAVFRVDPWVTGFAGHRLRRMTISGAPFRVGAYGWVDSPRPAVGAADDPPPAGPTAAGLLHAPSPTQALTAALLRDAAIRYPHEDRWQLRLDSAKIRAALRMAERVRLGTHPQEAFGLEVERIAGDWDTVRLLRKTFPLVADNPERRVCDGQRVIDAIVHKTEPVSALLAPLQSRLRPLADVLDTYADLLVAEGIHAMVSGQTEVAQAAMEAAAGLGAPPTLRAVRTPRAATHVQVSAYVLVQAATADADETDPRRVADPAFFALVETETSGQSANEANETQRMLTDMLRGGDGDRLDEALRSDLIPRRAQLLAMVNALRVELAHLAPGKSAATAAATAARWRIDTLDDGWIDAAIDDIDRRIDRFGGPAGTAAELREDIRGLCADPGLPVLAISPRNALPQLTPNDQVNETWLTVVAAVRPRLSHLESWQLDPGKVWPAAIHAPNDDVWHPDGPVIVAFGPALIGADATVAIAPLDAWTDSVPSTRHKTAASFGFNGPKSRAPEAVLIAVPPDRMRRLDNAGLVSVVLETRQTVRARVAPPVSTPAPLLSSAPTRGFQSDW
ncbi:hypothetical protein [Nocardia salmonicida]|uniref:hypothetical protein n=1 Tax=Nocardia salmonicida TaxID=53431 RepID=UPI0033F5D3BD